MASLGPLAPKHGPVDLPGAPTSSRRNGHGAPCAKRGRRGKAQTNPLLRRTLQTRSRQASWGSRASGSRRARTPFRVRVPCQARWTHPSRAPRGAPQSPTQPHVPRRMVRFFGSVHFALARARSPQRTVLRALRRPRRIHAKVQSSASATRSATRMGGARHGGGIARSAIEAVALHTRSGVPGSWLVACTR